MWWRYIFWWCHTFYSTSWVGLKFDLCCMYVSMNRIRLRLSESPECFHPFVLNFKRISCFLLHTHAFSNAFNHVSIVSRLDKRFKNTYHFWILKNPDITVKKTRKNSWFWLHKEIVVIGNTCTSTPNQPVQLGYASVLVC